MVSTRSAVVTGAAMGIGYATTRQLIADDVHVVGVDYNAQALTETANELGSGFTPIVGDVGDWNTHERAADAAEAVAPLHYWVNNAGVDILGGAHEVTPEQIDRGLRVLQMGAMYGAAIAVRRMLPHRTGSIVNISSIQGITVFPRFYIYQAAKAALIMISKGIAVDYGPYGIRCNAVLPGTVATPMSFIGMPTDPEGRQAALKEAGKLSPMQRIAEPEEIANTIVFLLSDKASYISGASIVVDGASSARCYAYPIPEEFERTIP